MIVYSAGSGGGTGAGGSCSAPRLLMNLVRAVLHKAADAAECEAADAAECEAADAAMKIMYKSNVDSDDWQRKVMMRNAKYKFV